MRRHKEHITFVTDVHQIWNNRTITPQCKYAERDKNSVIHERENNNKQLIFTNSTALTGDYLEYMKRQNKDSLKDKNSTRKSKRWQSRWGWTVQFYAWASRSRTENLNILHNLCQNRTCVNSVGTTVTHRCAMPALRTAQEMAFTAVPRALSSVVSSPVPLAFRPSSITKRVIVTTLVSKAPRSDIAADDLSRSPSVEAGPTVAELKCSATRNSVKPSEWKDESQSWSVGEVWPYWKHDPLCKSSAVMKW